MPQPGNGANLRGFEAVDLAPDTSALITSLQTAKTLPDMRAADADLLDELGLDRAKSALDIGCGLGADVVAMQSRAAAGARAVGLDVSRTMIDAARTRSLAAGTPVTFVVGSALGLPFGDGTFDACRAQTVLQHLHDPPRAVSEMARVTRPGGRAAAFEFDLGLTVLDHPDHLASRKIFDHIADAAHDAWLGRKLPRLFRQAGFADIRTRTTVIFNNYSYFRFVMRRPIAQLVSDHVISARQAAGWLSDLEQLDKAGAYLGGSTAFLVSGTRR